MISGSLSDNAGAVYIFVHSGRTWHRQATLTDSDRSGNDNFGHQVAISGTTVVVSAFAANNDAGAVYVFARSGVTWHMQAALHGVRSDLFFGISVAISDGTIVVGAQRNAGDAGDAYIFARGSGSTWHLQERLVDHSNTDNFGWSEAISGKTLMIGAPLAKGGVGAIYVYKRSGRHWSRTARLTLPHGSAKYGRFGYSIAVSRSRMLIGSPYQQACGAAYEFVRSGSSWHERVQVINPGCAYQDFFGIAIALSGKTAVIGAPDADKSAGAAYVVDLP